MLCAALTVEMKTMERDHPYVFNKRDSKHSFTLKYAKLESVLGLVRELHTIAQGSDAKYKGGLVF